MSFSINIRFFEVFNSEEIRKIRRFYKKKPKRLKNDASGIWLQKEEVQLLDQVDPIRTLYFRYGCSSFPCSDQVLEDYVITNIFISRIPAELPSFFDRFW